MIACGRGEPFEQRGHVKGRGHLGYPEPSCTYCLLGGEHCAGRTQPLRTKGTADWYRASVSAEFQDQQTCRITQELTELQLWRCGYQSEATADEHVLGVWFRGEITDAKLSSITSGTYLQVWPKHGPVFSEIQSPGRQAQVGGPLGSTFPEGPLPNCEGCD